MSKAVHNLLKVLCKQILKDPTKKPLMTFRDYSCRFVKRNEIPKSDTMFIPPFHNDCVGSCLMWKFYMPFMLEFITDKLWDNSTKYEIKLLKLNNFHLEEQTCKPLDKIIDFFKKLHCRLNTIKHVSRAKEIHVHLFSDYFGQVQIHTR